MDENDVGVIGNRMQSVAHTRRSSRPTCDDHDRSIRTGTIPAEFALAFDIVMGNDHDDAIAARKSRRHRMIDDSTATEILELFHRAEAPTRATSDDDRPDRASPFGRRTTALDIGHER
jgi:hypothetical protein